MILEYKVVREGDMSGCSTAEEITRLALSTIIGCEDKCNADKNCTYIWYKWQIVDSAIDCYLYSSCKNQPDYNQNGGKLIQKPGKDTLF